MSHNHHTQNVTPPLQIQTSPRADPPNLLSRVTSPPTSLALPDNNRNTHQATPASTSMPHSPVTVSLDGALEQWDVGQSGRRVGGSSGLLKIEIGEGSDAIGAASGGRKSQVSVNERYSSGGGGRVTGGLLGSCVVDNDD